MLEDSSAKRWVMMGAIGSIACATLGYAVYFDYKRRNDKAFREKLRK